MGAAAPRVRQARIVVGAAFRRPGRSSVRSRQRRHVFAERSVGARRKPASARTLPVTTRVTAESIDRRTRGHTAVAHPCVTDHAYRTRVEESLRPVSRLACAVRRKTFSEDMPAPPVARSGGARACSAGPMAWTPPGCSAPSCGASADSHQRNQEETAWMLRQWPSTSQRTCLKW